MTDNLITSLGQMDNNLTESLKIHDKYQFEIKFAYPLDTTRERNEYYLETFIFLPKNLFINQRTYSHNDFYTDMQKYIRLKTPVMRLKNIVPESPDSPLLGLKNSIKGLPSLPPDEEENNEQIDKYVEQMKMFYSIMKSAMRDESTLITLMTDPEDIEQRINEYIDEVSKIITSFRGLKPAVESSGLSENKKLIFYFADEFLSLTANKYKYKLIQFLGAHKEWQWQGSVKKALVSAARAEIDYRREQAYPSIPNPNSDNENVIYRENLLKKLMASVLFLNAETHKDGVLLENIIFSFAAGCAMAFALSVTFMTNKLFLTEFSTMLFFVTIIAYIFKDRIKDLTRTYFYRKVKPLLYDFRTDIKSTLGQNVGVCRESFTFMKGEKIPHVIRQMRGQNSNSILENSALDEDIIFSRKNVTLSSEACKNIFTDFKVNGIVDIVRFNVRRILMRMDNPEKIIFMPDPENDCLMKLKAKCIYHVNIIIRHSMPGCKSHFQRFRLILSRNGIRRIEMIPVPQEFETEPYDNKFYYRNH